jgi:GTP cyclohydrolase I
MKQKETSLNTPEVDDLIEALGEAHAITNHDTPLRENAFDLSDDEKIEQITAKFRDIMEIMGLDLEDDSLQGTPKRVAKMYVQEIFSGLNPANKPDYTLFDNKYRYDQMLVEKDITFYSNCEHHFVPIIGKAHVGYFSAGKVIGLSKINRIVQYFAKRPQVQERMTVQIAKELQVALQTEHVGVVIDATHLCVASRGVGDTNSTTGSAYFSGKFREDKYKQEFLNFINSK